MVRGIPLSWGAKGSLNNGASLRLLHLRLAGGFGVVGALVGVVLGDVWADLLDSLPKEKGEWLMAEVGALAGYLVFVEDGGCGEEF